MKIFGTKTDSSFVKITSKTVSTTPWKTIYKEVDSLAPGVERVTQYPSPGSPCRPGGMCTTATEI